MDTHMHAWMHEQGKPVIGVTACLAVLAVSVWGWLQVISLVPHRSENAPETVVIQSDSRPGASAASIEKPPRAATPAFTSLSLFADDLAGYSFWYPNGWEPLPLSSGGHAVTFAPTDGEGGAWFLIEAADAAGSVAEDAPMLVRAFHDAMGTLPDLCLEWEDQWVIGTIVGIEAKYTFHDSGATRKRWVRLLFDEGRQFSVTAQAASVEEYTYWEPMLFQMMTTVALDSDWYYPDESEDAPPQTGQTW